MKVVVPRLRRRSLRPPRVTLPRVRRGEPDVGDYDEVEAEDEEDIGEGPWYVKGYRASKPEYRVAKALEKLGRRFEFQVSKFGGRQIAGGQVLDFVLSDSVPLIIIDVRGYWHKGAAGEANDARKVFQTRAARPDAKYVIIWEEQTEDDQALLELLRQEIGARGGTRTTP